MNLKKVLESGLKVRSCRATMKTSGRPTPKEYGNQIGELIEKMLNGNFHGKVSIELSLHHIVKS